GCGAFTNALELDASPANLKAGTYHASLDVLSNTPGVPSQNVAVTFTVTPSSDPVIAVSSSAVTFFGPANADPPSQIIDLTNVGTGALPSLQAGFLTPTTWLTATFDHTTAPAHLTLSASIQNQPHGTQTAQVIVSSPDASNQAYIDVSFTNPVTPNIQ